jgi:hypothetical protein
MLAPSDDRMAKLKAAINESRDGDLAALLDSPTAMRCHDDCFDWAKKRTRGNRAAEHSSSKPRALSR